VGLGMFLGGLVLVCGVVVVVASGVGLGMFLGGLVLVCGVVVVVASGVGLGMFLGGLVLVRGGSGGVWSGSGHVPRRTGASTGNILLSSLHDLSSVRIGRMAYSGGGWWRLQPFT